MHMGGIKILISALVLFGTIDNKNHVAICLHGFV